MGPDVRCVNTDTFYLPVNIPSGTVRNVANLAFSGSVTMRENELQNISGHRRS
jgi:hypothetical protein